LSEQILDCRIAHHRALRARPHHRPGRSSYGRLARRRLVRTYRNGLYLTISNLEKTPKACLGFARRWGFLGNKAEAGRIELVPWWYHRIDDMRVSIENLAAGKVALPAEGIVVGRADIKILPGGSSGLSWSFAPQNLLTALWL
jgi:hypothetical protein